MAFKPIIDIDVNDEKFKAFAASFDRFIGKTKDIPEPFRDLERRIGRTRSEVSKLGAELDKRLKIGTKRAGAMGAAFAHFDKQIKRLPEKFKTLDRGIHKTAKEVGKLSGALKGIAGFALKGGGLGLGLIGVGAAFGLGDLASDAMNREKQAKSLGMKPGDVAAFDIYMKPYLQNPYGFLQGINKAAHNPADQRVMNELLGPGWPAMSKLQRAEKAAMSLSSIVKRNQPQTLEAMLNALGVSGLVGGVGGAEILKHTHRSSLLAADAKIAKAAPNLAFSRKTAREWANLDVQLREAGVTIGTVLIRDLSGLAPMLTKYSTEFAHWLGDPQRTAEIKAAITQFAHWLESPKIGEAFHQFAHLLESPKVGEAFHQLEHWFESPKLGNALHTLGDATVDAAKGIIDATKFIENALHPNRPDAKKAPLAHIIKGTKHPNAMHGWLWDQKHKTPYGALPKDTHKHWYNRWLWNAEQFDKGWWGIGQDPGQRAFERRNLQFLKNPKQFVADIHRAAKANGIPARFLRNQMMAESGGNPNAVSNKGAMGLMQFMPDTWKEYGHGNPFNPRNSINAAARYDAVLYRKFHNLKDTAAAYNEGPGNFQKVGIASPGVQAYADKLMEGITKSVGERIHVHVHVHQSSSPAANIAQSAHAAAR